MKYVVQWFPDIIKCCVSVMSCRTLQDPVDGDDMNRHNIQSRYKQIDKLYIPHTDHLTFMCIRGTTHEGRLAMRRQCIDGVIIFPTCL